MIAQHAKITLADYNLHQVELPLSQLTEQWENIKEKMALLPYPQDGIVLKFADPDFRNSLGSTAHHPRGEIAYKFTNIQKTTVLRDVEWSSGKNCLTPVAIFDPIEISGTTITRATLHNVENLLALGVMIGDNITVERAGDVIPHITGSTPGAIRQDAMIHNCPKCGTAVIRSGPELVCPNTECPGTVLQLLSGAVRCFGIDNLGGATLEKLYSRGLVRHVRDLFHLTAADLLRIDGFASKSVTNLLNELEKAKNVNDYQLLASLNIPGIGLNIAKQMLAVYSIAELRRMSPEQLATIPGIGPERAAAIEKELRNQSAYLDELLSAVNLIESENAETSNKTVCFTGKMPQKRSFYENLAEQHGYRAVSDVTRELTVLVAADPAASGGKLDKARKYDVSIVALADFLDRLQQNETASVPQDEPEDSLFSALDMEPETPEKSDPPKEAYVIQGELF